MKREINRRLGKIEAATAGAPYTIVFKGEPIPSHTGKLVIVVPKRGAPRASVKRGTLRTRSRKSD